MGFSGIGFTELLLILLLVALLLGSRRLVGLGSDLGSALRNFRQSLSGDAEERGQEGQAPSSQTQTPPALGAPPAPPASAPPADESSRRPPPVG